MSLPASRSGLIPGPRMLGLYAGRADPVAKSRGGVLMSGPIITVVAGVAFLSSITANALADSRLAVAFASKEEAGGQGGTEGKQADKEGTAARQGNESTTGVPGERGGQNTSRSEK